jgi:hypothetical protein
MLYLYLSGAAVFGFFLGALMARASRETDERTITGLRTALRETHDALGEANLVKDEAVAAAERAEAALKEQFERKSQGSKNGWAKRKGEYVNAS